MSTNKNSIEGLNLTNEEMYFHNWYSHENGELIFRTFYRLELCNGAEFHCYFRPFSINDASPYEPKLFDFDPHALKNWYQETYGNGTYRADARTFKQNPPEAINIPDELHPKNHSVLKFEIVYPNLSWDRKVFQKTNYAPKPVEIVILKTPPTNEGIRNLRKVVVYKEYGV